MITLPVAFLEQLAPTLTMRAVETAPKGFATKSAFADWNSACWIYDPASCFNSWWSDPADQSTTNGRAAVHWQRRNRLQAAVPWGRADRRVSQWR